MALALLLALLSVAFPAGAQEDIGVHVQQAGSRIVVDVNFPVAATALETWNVMTDYDHMASFVSNLQLSRIISHDGNTLVIEQKGKAARGPFTFSFENVREIVLTPFREVRSRMISGDLEMSEFKTLVIDHGDSSEIVNHGEFIPRVWVPPIIGPAVIEAETRKQFQEFRAEILRRKAQAASEKP